MRLFRQSTAMPDVPAETHIHNSPPSYAGAIFAIAGTVMVFLLLGWRGIVYLFAQAGARQPEHAAANALLWLVGGGIALVLVTAIANTLLDKFLAHRERMADKQIEMARQMARMQQSQSVDMRVQSPDDIRVKRLIEHVIVDIFAHGEYKNNESRPWARAQLQEVVLANEASPVGYKLANRARAWLKENEVIIGANGREQPNFRRYPDVASVQRALYGVALYRK